MRDARIPMVRQHSHHCQSKPSFCRSKRYEDVQGVRTVHTQEIGLQGLTLAWIVLHQISYLEDTTIGSLDHLNVVLGIFAYNRTDAGNDVGHLVVFASVGGTGLDVGNVDERLLCGIEVQRNGGNVFALVELITYAEALEVFVSVKLLVVVVGDGGLEFHLIIRAHHRHGVTTEIGAGHCHNMSITACHNAADSSSQVVHFVSGCVVEFVDADERVIEQRNVQFLESIAEGGVSADKNLSITRKEVNELLAQPALFETGGAKVITLADLPICKKAIGLELGVLEGTSNRLFRHGYDYPLDALVGQLSRATNISALLLPDAGGALTRRY